jgi:hypothetical protein
MLNELLKKISEKGMISLVNYLVDFVLVIGRVKLFGDHKSGVIGLQEALLVGPGVQIAQTLVHAVHAHLFEQSPFISIS